MKRSNQDVFSLVVSLTMIAACGGSGSGSGGSSALVGSYWKSKGTSSTGSTQIQIYASSRADACKLDQENADAANSTAVELDLTAAAGQRTLPPGTYNVASDGDIQGQSKVRDGSCEDTKIDATSGTITLSTSLGTPGSAASGSFNLTFEDGSHRSGSFTAGFCDMSVTVPPGPACIGGTDANSSGGASGSSGSGGFSSSSGGFSSSSGGATPKGGSTSTTGWGTTSTCNSGASVIYRCCALSGTACQQPSAYASCCENTSCNVGKGIACLAPYESNTLDPTTCTADLQACGL